MICLRRFIVTFVHWLAGLTEACLKVTIKHLKPDREAVSMS